MVDIAEQQQGDVPNALAERVQRLGLKLYPSETTFPCGKIPSHLMLLNCVATHSCRSALRAVRRLRLGTQK